MKNYVSSYNQLQGQSFQNDSNSINNFLPTFLVNEITKEEINKENVLLYEDKDDEALEIKMDPFYYNINNQFMNSNYASLMNNSNITTPSARNRWNSEKSVRKYCNSDYLPNFPNQMQCQNQQKLQNDIISQRKYSDNFNSNNNLSCNFPHELTTQMMNQDKISNISNFSQNFPQQFQNNNRFNIGNNNNFSSNNKPLYRNNYPGFNDSFQEQLNNSKFILNQNNLEYNYNQERADRLDSPHSSSTNISILEENFNHLSFYHPLPKKMNSESNVTYDVKRKDITKSLFKEKTEETNTIVNNCNENDSPHLFEFMNKRNHDLAEFIKSQKGSRIMQKELNVISNQTLDRLIDILSPNFCRIMNDTYGNYFSQKLIQCCTAPQRLRILQAISKDLVSISLNPAGTHSIQSLIEIINLKEEEEVIKESIKNDVLKLAYDSNSTHVLQKAILLIEEKNREHINNILLENMQILVLDSNGICVIKKLINGNKDINIKRSILKIIEKNCIEIIQNPFGNYIIQHIIDEWGYDECKDVVKIIHQNIISLSMQKFSSNVVEKCLDVIDQKTKEIWIKDIFNFSKLSSLLKNKYGNFVLQKAIMVMSHKEKGEIKEYLTKKMENISNKEKPRLKGLMDML